jgi:hypothetical protein
MSTLHLSRSWRAYGASSPDQEPPIRHSGLARHTRQDLAPTDIRAPPTHSRAGLPLDPASVTPMTGTVLGQGTTSGPYPVDGGGGQQACEVRVDRTGLHVDAAATGDLPRWVGTWKWIYLESLEVQSTIAGVILAIIERGHHEYQVELHDVTAATVDAGVAPFRLKIGAAPPPPTEEELARRLAEPVDDVTFEPHRAGIEVWFCDELSHGQSHAVDEFVDWLVTYRGVGSAWREDRALVIATGEFSHRNLKRDVRQWWRRRVPGLRLS